MILVSACLAGANCAWDGGTRTNKRVKDMVDAGEAIAVCPEVLGGRSIPRTRTEISGGNGGAVLCGRARVLDENGEDVTEEFLKGARAALKIARENGINEALLKARSPSCGVYKIYDGSFSGTLREGEGVTTALLKREGIDCKSL